MRRFRLINGVGEVLDLTRTDMFLSDPSGLGFEQQATSIAVGSDYILTDTQVAQNVVAATMSFGGYRQYSEFVHFAGITPLVLQYAPNGDVWHSVDCRLTSITKGEMESGHLPSGITLLCLGRWYIPAEIKKTSESAAPTKKYSYRYPYTYVDVATGGVTIYNRGNIDSPCRLHIMGKAINPSWALFAGNVKLADGKIFATIDAGQKLVVDASPATMEISRCHSDGAVIESLYQLSDFSTGRFVYVPPGEHTLTFAHEGTGTINALVEVKQLATTV